ncbi:MAG TPA: ABC transporter ATP-binding protein, partial [Thermodesulfobacteriota bacterium]|nr:ABC transporter ATP-binding protein [Thermodesulfobacteriota bacterium]
MSRTVRRVLAYLRPYRRRAAAVLLLVGAANGLSLLMPWPLSLVVDHVLGGRPLPSWLAAALPAWAAQPGSLLAAAVVAALLLEVAGAGLRLAETYLSIDTGQRMVNDLRADLYTHLQRLSLAFHTRQRVGDLIHRVLADTFAVQSLVMNGFVPALSAATLLAGMAAVMVRVHAGLALLALGFVPLLALAVALIGARIKGAATRAREEEGDIYAFTQEALALIPVIQAFTREDDSIRRFVRASRSSLQAFLRLYTVQTLFGETVTLLLGAGAAALLYVGARQVLEGTLTVGTLLVFLAYLRSLYTPVNSLVGSFGVVRAAEASAERVFALLATPPPVAERPGARPLPPVRGRVAFEAVSFAYEPGRPVLQEVSFVCEPGETLAIVGPTGVGKTTIAALILRFVDPTAGRVTIDGYDLRDVQLRTLRSQISLVLQEPLLFSGTVRDNIAIGRPGATDEEIVEAARQARAHDFIVRLPQGYDTPLGERGVRLSGGERQRLSLARAFLKEAPILVLDEPTSALDAETEALVVERLAALAAGRTTIIIAHRL